MSAGWRTSGAQVLDWAFGGRQIIEKKKEQEVIGCRYDME